MKYGIEPEQVDTVRSLANELYNDEDFHLAGLALMNVFGETFAEKPFDYRYDALEQAIYQPTGVAVDVLGDTTINNQYCLTFIDSDGLIKADGAHLFIRPFDELRGSGRIIDLEIRREANY